MSDPHPAERGAASASGVHLSDWTLEQIAEGLLPPEEERAAALHLAQCPRCAAEAEGYRALFAALGDLPRLAPSPGFADAVIARTRLSAAPGPVMLWLRQFVPKTRRGWVLLGTAVVAPALPILAAAIWLLTHPLLTPMGLGQWISLQLRGAGQAAAAWVLDWAADSRITGPVRGAYELARTVPLEAVTALVVLLAIAIPLSAWAILRLARTPMRDATYAN